MLPIGNLNTGFCVLLITAQLPLQDQGYKKPTQVACGQSACYVSLYGVLLRQEFKLGRL
ncbi:predicted protein [Plenodomus lingam JN3]|uniref:Predicted protein n=1 Tax=Leptosphaeria maculans (strain JN3 / isolate v23.1.3 / race Av1-4-5-6-7-8) TaxID=985895 RepID=E5A1M7_LEPMJ|nr:predicted protein [Plenodomus lingam JN3]CBX97491.1 predicted protein [Plenodomus lingam JN3]